MSSLLQQGKHLILEINKEPDSAHASGLKSHENCCPEYTENPEAA